MGASSETAKSRFRDIVLPHLDDGYALARWIVGADAEDVVQEAAIRALAALDATVPLRARPWWLAIVRNCALDSLRRRSRQGGAHADLEDCPEVADDAPDPERALIARDEGARVRAALDALPPLLRETLLLREVEELDYREIAAATQAPIGTVMSRLSRARAALLQKLGKTR